MPSFLQGTENDIHAPISFYLHNNLVMHIQLRALLARGHLVSFMVGKWWGFEPGFPGHSLPMELPDFHSH